MKLYLVQITYKFCFIFVKKATVLFACFFVCVVECFWRNSPNRPGNNEIPGAERRQTVQQQMWLDSLPFAPH